MEVATGYKLSAVVKRVQADTEITDQADRFTDEHTLLFADDELNDRGTTTEGNLTVGESVAR